MADTYIQCYIHLVFAVKNRDSLIKNLWKNELEMYITGIIQNHHHKLLAIFARPDHIHIFIGYNVNQLIPNLVSEIKTSTNGWINAKKFSNFKFDWQKGYGAFTHSHSQINTIIQYIKNQEIHHQKMAFRKEYLDLLQKNEIDFNDQYLFVFFDDVLELN
jgi:putative transposase